MKSAKTKQSSPAANEQAAFFAKESDQDFFGPSEKEAQFFSPANTTSGSIQTKLSVGQVNDPYEKEADSVAEQVVQRKHEPVENSSQKKVKSGVKKISRKPIFESDADPREDEVPEERLLRKEAGTAENTSIPDSLEGSLNSSKATGEKLSPQVNQSMSDAIGSDFSNVRIHHDTGAAALSRDLHAQAFTHGQDIYFNSGKYNPETTEGKRLLAHELTHTVQQGASPNAPSISKAPEIQLDGKPETPDKNVKDIDAKTLADMGATNKIGFLSKNGDGKVEVHFKEFPTKQYVGPFVTKDKQGNEQLATPPFLKPTAERKTKQSNVWKKEALPMVTKLLQNIIDKNQVKGTEYKLELKNKKDSAATGTLDQIAKQVVVPFWGMDGLPISYQIEHKVDWQIAGGNHDVDVISNLILLDAKSNIEVGQTILNSMRERYAQLIKFYTDQKKVAGLAAEFGAGSGLYDILCDNLVSDGVNVGQSLVSISNFEEKATQTPFAERIIDLSELVIPDGKFIMKTAKSGAGMFVPMDLDNDFIKIEWDKTAKELKSITLKNVVKDEKGVLDKDNPNKPLGFKKDGDRRYKVDSAGFAVVLKSMFRGIKAMSPLDWTDIDFNPITGLTATAEIKTELDFLKGIKLLLEVVNSEFTVYATINSDILRGKFPKPFDVEYSSLTLFAGTKKKFGGAGEVGFGIDKIGKGSVRVEMQGENFGLTGKLALDGKEKFEKAELKFTYTKEGDKGKWEASGDIAFNQKLIKAVKSGNINISYDGKTFSGTGKLELVLPKFKGLELSGQIKENGDFIITAAAKIDSLPGVKDVDAKVTVQKEGADYKLGMSGSATPSLPKVPGLKPKPLTISYENKVFTIKGGADYSKGKINGTLNIGVTNGTVEGGKPTNSGKEESSELVIFGDGSATIELFPGMKASISAELDTKGDIWVWGDLKFEKQLFSGIKKNFNLFSIAQSIPLFGVPFAAIVLRFGGSADLEFNWDPLTLTINTTLDKAKLDDLEKGKLGGGFDVGLKSSAQAKIGLTLSIGIGVELAVFAVSLNGNGTIGFGIKGDLGTSLSGTWSLEKGLQLKEGKATFNTGLFVFAELKGTVLVELNMLVSRVTIYTYELGSVKKSLDAKDFSLGVTVPMKIDQAGKLEGFDFTNVQFTPEFKKGNEDKMLKKITGTEEAPPPVPDQKEQAKAAMRKEIRSKLETRGANSSVDMARYATDLRGKMQKTTPELSMEINQMIEEEFIAVEYKQFLAFRVDLMSSKGTMKAKLAKVDAFEKTHTTVPKADIDILRQEVKDQTPDTPAPNTAQRKEMDSPGPNPEKEAPLFNQPSQNVEATAQMKSPGQVMDQVNSIDDNKLQDKSVLTEEDKKEKGEVTMVRDGLTAKQDGKKQAEEEKTSKEIAASKEKADSVALPEIKPALQEPDKDNKESKENDQKTGNIPDEKEKSPAEKEKAGPVEEKKMVKEGEVKDGQSIAKKAKDGEAVVDEKGDEKKEKEGKPGDEKKKSEKEEKPGAKQKAPIEPEAGGKPKTILTVPNVAEDVTSEFHPLPSLGELLEEQKQSEAKSPSAMSPVQKKEDDSAQPDPAGIKDSCISRITSSRKNISDNLDKEVVTLRDGLTLNAETVRNSTLGVIYNAIADTKGKVTTAREELNVSAASTRTLITIDFLLKMGETIQKAQKTKTDITDLFSNHKINIDKAATEGIASANKLRDDKQKEAREKVSEQLKRARSMREQRVNSYPDTERGRVQKDAARSMANDTISEIAAKTPDTVNAIAEVVQPIPDEFRKKAEEAKQGLDEHVAPLLTDIDAKMVEILGQLQTAYAAALAEVKQTQEKLDDELTKIEESAVAQLQKLIPQVNAQIDVALNTSLTGLETSKTSLAAQLVAKADEAITIIKGSENPEQDKMESFTNTIITFLESSSSESISLFQQNVLLMEEDTAKIYDNVCETTGIFKVGTNKALMKWRQAKELAFQSLLEKSKLQFKGMYDSMAIPFDEVVTEIKTTLTKTLDELKAGYAKSIKDAEPKITEAITEGLAKNEEVLNGLDGKMVEAADDAAWDYDHPILSAIGDVLSFIAGLILGILAVLALVVVIIIAFKLAIVGLVALGISLVVAEFIVAVAGLALLARGIYKSYTARTERGEKGGIGTFLWSIGDVTGVSSIIHGFTAEGLSPFERGFSIGEGIGTIASFFLARKIDKAITGKLPPSIANPGGATPPVGPRAFGGESGGGRLADVIPISRGKIIRAGRTGGGGGGTTSAYSGGGTRGATALAEAPKIIPEPVPEIVPEVVPEPVPEVIPETVGKAGTAKGKGVAPEIGAGAAAGLNPKTKPKEKENKQAKLYKWGNMNYQGRVGGLTYTKSWPGVDWTLNGHHVWPKTLGGIDSQTLMTVIRTIHSDEMHYGYDVVGSPVVQTAGSIYEFLQNGLNASPTYGPNGLDILQGRDLTHPGGANSGNALLIAAMKKGTATAKNLAGYVRRTLTVYYSLFQPFSSPMIPYNSYRKGLDDAFNEFA